MSGRRIVATKRAISGREAALEYVLCMGCVRDEIISYGVDGVAWRGAVYRGVAVVEDDDPLPAAVAA